MSFQEKIKNYHWLNQPADWRIDNGLVVTTDPKTDFWQRTHYGFQRDNGHFFYREITGNFTLIAQVEFASEAQYDQCGLMCRVNSDNWIKCSIELETDELSRLGSVVTNLGYSDWATQDVPSTIRKMSYRMVREGMDFSLYWAEDGKDWAQMRIAHLFDCPPQIAVGVYVCSPIGSGFLCAFKDITISETVV